jgi:Protein of Unknown function (DUF2784)
MDNGGHAVKMNSAAAAMFASRSWLVDLQSAATSFTTEGAYSTMAAGVLMLHLLFILWVIFGVVLAHRRPLLRWLHVASLIWGILIEVFPWSCPLTVLENWLEARAGVAAYQGGFILHYLDALVYPDVSVLGLTIAGILVCAVNLGYYAILFVRSGSRRL